MPLRRVPAVSSELSFRKEWSASITGGCPREIEPFTVRRVLSGSYRPSIGRLGCVTEEKRVSGEREWRAPRRLAAGTGRLLTEGIQWLSLLLELVDVALLVFGDELRVGELLDLDRLLLFLLAHLEDACDLVPVNLVGSFHA